MLRQRILDFLYEQVKSNKISQIKKGMVEEFEAFIEGIVAEKEASMISARMRMAQSKETVLDDVAAGVMPEAKEDKSES